MPYPVAAVRNKNFTVPTDLCAITITGFTGGGDSFDCYAEQDPVTTSLAHGKGFNGAWNLASNYLQVQGLETFQFYDLGSDVSDLDGGTGWDGAWNIATNFSQVIGGETFDTYNFDGPIN
jgi:hypothetical protein